MEIVCYFATKSIDEFLSLQQTANLEVIGAVHECGAVLALPTSLMQMGGSPLVASAGVGTENQRMSITNSHRSPDSKFPVESARGQVQTTAVEAAQSDLADEMELADALFEFVETSTPTEHTSPAPGHVKPDAIKLQSESQL